MKISPAAMTLLILIFVGVLAGAVVTVRAVRTPETPDVALPTTNNETFRLSDQRGRVVVLEFFAISCAPCRIVEKELAEAVPTWDNATVTVASIAMWGETVEDLRTFQRDHNITWTVAPNADDANLKFNVYDIPQMLILDADGAIVWRSSTATISSETMREKVAAAQAGRLQSIGSVQYGLWGLAIVAGAAAFFSPCAIGMLPAYVAQAVRRPDQGEAAGRRAGPLRIGGFAAVGVLLVFFAIGGFALLLGPPLLDYVPYLQPLIGFLLLVAGLLLLLRPYSERVQRWTAPLVQWAGEQTAQRRTPGAFFAYGLGYGAAAAGCTTPVLLSVLVTATAYGPLVGSGVVALYALSGAFLMVLVTVAAGAAGEGLGARLARASRAIEIVSALLFILGGIFLIAYAVRSGTFAA